MTESLNPTEQRIYAIIRADVCGICNASPFECEHHSDRCYAGYERQAKAIYAEVVRPLEDDVAIMPLTP
jgi:hypothetical protein